MQILTVTEANFVYVSLRAELTKVEEKLNDIKQFPEEFSEGEIMSATAEAGMLHTILDKLVAA